MNHFFGWCHWSSVSSRLNCAEPFHPTQRITIEICIFGTDFWKEVDIDTDSPGFCGICETKFCEKLLKSGEFDGLRWFWLRNVVFVDGYPTGTLTEDEMCREQLTISKRWRRWMGIMSWTTWCSKTRTNSKGPSSGCLRGIKRLSLFLNRVVETKIEARLLLLWNFLSWMMLFMRSGSETVVSCYLVFTSLTCFLNSVKVLCLFLADWSVWTSYFVLEVEPNWAIPELWAQVSVRCSYFFCFVHTFQIVWSFNFGKHVVNMKLYVVCNH